MSSATHNLDSLAGRRILITGATGVLGRALSLRLSQSQAELILIAKRRAKLEELDDAIAQAGGRSPILVELDFLRADEKLYKDLAQQLAIDGVDDMVLCSGLHTGLHPLDHLPSKHWHNILNVNLNGPFQLIHHLLPLLKYDKGHIIGVSDAPAREQKAFWGAYAVSKAGLDALLHICAQETENQVHVSRMEARAMPSPIRAAVYPGESRANLPPVSENVDEILALLSEHIHAVNAARDLAPPV